MAASSKKDIPKTDCFLTHDWGIDEKGRANHQRVAIINQSLNELGYVTWFDEERMEGEVRQKMVNGINGTRVVIVFVTKRYMDKVNGYGTTANDNAKMEFDYAFDTKTRQNMICVVMDDTMTNPSNWEDILKMTMGGCIFVAMNGDLEDEAYLKKQMKELEHQLTLKGVTPSKAKKHCPKCNVPGEGTFCMNCGTRMQKVGGDDKKPSSDVQKNTKIIPTAIQKKFEAEGFSYIDSLMRQNEYDNLALLVGKCMNLRNKQNDSPVLRAAALGNVKALRVLIENGAKFDDLNDNDTILHRAAANDCVECVRYIAKTYPVLLSRRAKYDQTPVLYAAAWGKLKAMKALIEEGANFYDVNDCGDTILHRAASGDHVECVKYIAKTYPQLISHKAQNDETPVLYAASWGKLNAMKELIEYGANFKDVSNSGNSILHRAAGNDRIESIKYIAKTYPLLLSQRAKDGDTPVLYAAACGKLKAMKVLIEYGANFNDVNDSRDTLLHRAAAGDHMECVRYIAKTYPQFLSQKAEKDETPVLYAASWDKLNAMKILIESGAKFDDVNEKGNTILHKAAATGRIECTKYISKTYPVFLAQKNKEGYTALHLASYNGKLECIKVLLAAGCDVSQKDPSSRSNIDLARLGGHKDCENELKKW